MSDWAIFGALWLSGAIVMASILPAAHKKMLATDPEYRTMLQDLQWLAGDWAMVLMSLILVIFAIGWPVTLLMIRK